MNRLVRLAALALPLAGLAGLWFLSDRTFQQGTEWEVPIDGFDPRDFLRRFYYVGNPIGGGRTPLESALRQQFPDDRA